jgi:hypothetical protein
VQSEVQSEVLEHTLKLTGQPLIPMISSPDHQEQHGTRIGNDGSPELGAIDLCFLFLLAPRRQQQRQGRETSDGGIGPLPCSIKSRQSPRLNFFR